MSDKNTDKSVNQTANGLGKSFKTVGNLFSKEKDAETKPRKKASGSSGVLYLPISPGNDLLMRHQEHFFKFFDRVGIDKLLEGYDETQVLESERIILNVFVNGVDNIKTAAEKNWSALKHYIYFIYRHAISTRPFNSNEIFSNIVTRNIRDLIDTLSQEDFTQLCLRLIMLIREYTIAAKGHFDHFDFPRVATYLVSLMSYYSAFCSAASKLAPLLPEFDFLIMERYNVNWLCLNKSIFYYYFYMNPTVQSMIPQFLKLKENNTPANKNLLETYSCFYEDMSLLAARWGALRIRIKCLSQKRALSDPEKHLLDDWKMFEEHKRILNSNYWIVRSVEEMQLQDMTELDTHILSLIGDTANLADVLLDSLGHCLCEDCLIAEFRASSVTAPVIPSPFQGVVPAYCRLVTCYICQDPVALDSFATHIVTKHHDSPTQKPTRVYLTPHQKKLFCPQKPLQLSEGVKSRDDFPFEGLFELKESILQIVQERAARANLVTYDIQEGSSKDEDNLNNTEETQELKHKMARPSEAILACQSSAPIFHAPAEVMAKSVKEPTFKIASKAPVMQNGEEVMLKGASKTKEDVWTCKAHFDDYIKKYNDDDDSSIPLLTAKHALNFIDTVGGTSRKPLEFVKKTAEVFPKDFPKNISESSSSNATIKKTFTVTNSSVSLSENVAFRKPQQKGIDPKKFDFLKNSTSKSPNSTSKSDNSCLGHACGHKCKDDDKQNDAKKHSCLENGEYHKESRKCECAYCEVFGTGLSSHAHKTNETRDRLRTRLNQRKEKVIENATKAAKLLSTQNNGGSNAKPANSNVTPKPLLLNPGKVVPPNSGGFKPKAVPHDGDSNVPPRVPEVHPASPPINIKLSTLPDEKPRNASPPRPVKPMTDKEVCDELDKIVSTLTTWSSSTSSTSSLNSIHVDSRDINELLNYIEGNKTVDKAALAHKKAAKKARQRLKKAQERERFEKEKKLKEEARLKEEKRKEEERLKAEALLKQQLAEKQKKIKKEKAQEEVKVQIKPDAKKNPKKKGKTSNENANSSKHQQATKNAKLTEETIPAMVTIKRVTEGKNSQATVTITLKGSTPESDKLLLTLVDGHSKERVTTAVINTDKKATKIKTEPPIKVPPPQQSNVNNNKANNNEAVKNAKKKKKEVNDATNAPTNAPVKDKITATPAPAAIQKQVKAALAFDKNNATKKENFNKKDTKLNEVFKPVYETKTGKVTKEPTSFVYSQPKPPPKDDINLPMLRLPPGITITKIEGPPANRNCKIYNTHNTNMLGHNSHQTSNVPVSKSGVIVVDTEKLIQQSINASNDKKNRKKNKKKQRELKNNPEANEMQSPKGVNAGNPPTPMVTLKNPIFDTLQSNLSTKPPEHSEMSTLPNNNNNNNNQQASIFTNPNGMVTIRSPRLQNPYENGAPISNFMTDMSSGLRPEAAPYVPMCSNFPEYNQDKSFNAQQILSGLPGIEITKVDKTVGSKNESEARKVLQQPAEVSIIPTSNGANNAENFNFDKDEWTFDVTKFIESVFAPKDVLEDDMDADERELEDFKRFCQESVPPERKEKVAHLNVQDIILNKKKNDVTFS